MRIVNVIIINLFQKNYYKKTIVVYFVISPPLRVPGLLTCACMHLIYFINTSTIHTHKYTFLFAYDVLVTIQSIHKKKKTEATLWLLINAVDGIEQRNKSSSRG